MIILDDDIYDALVRVATEFRGLGSGAAHVWGKPLVPYCALGSIAYADTGEPMRMWEPWECSDSDTRGTEPKSEMVTRAEQQGLNYQLNDEIIRSGGRMPIDEFLAKAKIVRRSSISEQADGSV